jgi:hypothetical protein
MRVSISGNPKAVPRRTNQPRTHGEEFDAARDGDPNLRTDRDETKKAAR